jgi:hypothetical protein
LSTGKNHEYEYEVELTANQAHGVA